MCHKYKVQGRLYIYIAFLSFLDYFFSLLLFYFLDNLFILLMTYMDQVYFSLFSLKHTKPMCHTYAFFYQSGVYFLKSLNFLIPAFTRKLSNRIIAPGVDIHVDIFVELRLVI